MSQIREIGPPKEIQVKSSAQRRLESGHRWVYGNEVTSSLVDYEAGELVAVRRGTNKLGIGTVNPHSLIAVRLLSDRNVEIDQGFFRERIEAADRRRQSALPGASMYRVIHGESDGLPGLVVDRYGDYLVVRVLTVGMDTLRQLWLPALMDVFNPTAVIARNDTEDRAYEHLPEEVVVLHGDAPEQVEVAEGNLTLAVDLMAGPRTGHCLDRKAARAELPSLSGARVLDAFSGTGAWGIAAALAGAERVVGLDVAKPWVDLAKRNAELNGVAEKCRFEVDDVLESFGLMTASDEKFDAVIVDPPALAMRASQVNDALSDYRGINIGALEVLAPGGLLITTCESRPINAERFRGVISHAERASNRTLQLVGQYGAPADHPVLLSMKETEYFTCLMLRAVD